MNAPFYYSFKENNFWLSPGRTIFWEEKKALIVSDLHFGKTGHFRKSGIAVPQNIFKEDIQRLMDQLSYFKAEQLIVVGDLFHSESNKELDLFLKWRKDFSSLQIHLIKGNHDILKNEWYENANMIVYEHELIIQNISFIHDIQDAEEKQELYYISGHIHPGISIKGAGKQNLRFPCFYFGERYAVLPAFSKFTGFHAIELKRNETAFTIVENAIVPIQ
jgi:DNA ligase-associated metallophosphoesterase